jgi:hypothetical protein
LGNNIDSVIFKDLVEDLANTNMEKGKESVHMTA